MDFEALANENARRNYSLHTDTFDAEHMLQISCGGEILVTICQPAGPSIAEVFYVFNGTGLADDDTDLGAEDAVKIFKVEDEDVNSAWREAVKFGYGHALAKMMCADAKAERLLVFA